MSIKSASGPNWRAAFASATGYKPGGKRDSFIFNSTKPRAQKFVMEEGKQAISNELRRFLHATKPANTRLLKLLLWLHRRLAWIDNRILDLFVVISNSRLVPRKGGQETQ